MVTKVNYIGYTNSYPTVWMLKPRQPIAGNASVTSAAEVTLYQYDIITPYAIGDFVVSNSAQTSRVMVGWGMITRLALVTAQAMTYRIYADLYDGTFVLVDPGAIAIAASANVQIITSPVIPAFRIRGTLQAVTTTDTVEYHASLTDY